ncbi:hypothetical protein EVJ58_g133 [Rhodofomes roseus]|uniref:pH-response regulator protein palC n=1 Tax=Rhodofomes roseus TaxID=34475 RepID=A0A4Y9Z788_9APHY|nr:hypothetical protein EVJ58_g133 [Rhodofomes roseus]
MTTFLYELPTTGAIFFAGVCDDKTGSYTTEIAEATEARANLRAALKESKRADDGGKDYLKLVKVHLSCRIVPMEAHMASQVLDDYLPQLYGIVICVQEGELVLKTEPIFSWRTTLSSSLFHNSPRLSIPTLSTEVIFTLLTYAFALSNLSRTVVHSLGAYERERAISDAERKAKDEKLQFAVTLLCKASGVFEYIAKDCIQEWERERDRVAAAGMTCLRPPDLTREVVIGLSKMALADAQTLAIRKLLSRAAFDSTITPGPPLPKSHPSPMLISKLHLECAALYTSARSLAKTPGDYRPASSTKSKLKSAFSKDRSEGAVRDEGGGRRTISAAFIPHRRRGRGLGDARGDGSESSGLTGSELGRFQRTSGWGSSTSISGDGSPDRGHMRIPVVQRWHSPPRTMPSPAAISPSEASRHSC